MQPDGTAEPVTDSPTGWVARHIQEYASSGGRRGHHRWGVTHLLLTTRGRRSGTLRRTALIYRQDGERYVVVASNGGSPRHPAWYLNLRSDPRVAVQVGGETFAASARPAEGEERERLWELMAEVWPDYRRYQQRTGREIPVVVLEP